MNVVWDVSINCVRMIPLPEDESELNVQTFHTLSKEVHQAVYQGDSRMPETSPKIPRPPNSFILYRQSRHKEVTAANPGVPNTEICKLAKRHTKQAINKFKARIIAQMWRQETEQVRAHWTEMADRLRQQHVNEHPDYRYSPRRPNQINRRRTRVPAGSVAHLIANTSAGEQRLRVARQFPNNEIRNLDTAFVESLENGISLYGPNGVGPQLVTATDDFYQILQDQIDRIPLEPVQFGALDDPEFPEELPIDELLNLPGAN